MADLTKILKKKNDRLDTVPTSLNDAVVSSQNPIWNELLSLIQSLDVVGGDISVTEANLLRVQEIISSLERTVLLEQTGYTSSIRSYAAEYDTQITVNNGYFKEFFAFETSKLGQGLVNNKKREAVELLLEIEPTYLQPIRNTLNESIGTGQKLSDLIKQLQTLTIGDDEVNGKLAGHAKQISSDLFSIADRSYTNAVAEDLGIQWFFYSGGVIESTKNARGKVTSSGTRSFCKARNGHYYHKKEIEKWATGSGSPSPSGTWDGKIAATNKSNIFIYAGGWNCKHSIMGTGITGVPRSDIIRNINNGNFKPNKTERELLAI